MLKIIHNSCDTKTPRNTPCKHPQNHKSTHRPSGTSVDLREILAYPNNYNPKLPQFRPRDFLGGEIGARGGGFNPLTLSSPNT